MLTLLGQNVLQYVHKSGEQLAPLPHSTAGHQQHPAVNNLLTFFQIALAGHRVVVLSIHLALPESEMHVDRRLSRFGHLPQDKIEIQPVECCHVISP
jgi:hypothetical protein